MKKFHLTDSDKELIIKARKSGISIDKIINIFGASSEIKGIAKSVKATRSETIQRFNEEASEVILEQLRAIVDGKEDIEPRASVDKEDGFIILTPAVERIVNKYIAMGIPLIDIINAAAIRHEDTTKMNRHVKLNKHKKVKSLEEVEIRINEMLDELNKNTYTHRIVSTQTSLFDEVRIKPYVKQWPNGKKVFITKFAVSVPYIHALHKDYEVK